MKTQDKNQIIQPTQQNLVFLLRNIALCTWIYGARIGSLWWLWSLNDLSHKKKTAKKAFSLCWFPLCWNALFFNLGALDCAVIPFQAHWSWYCKSWVSEWVLSFICILCRWHLPHKQKDFTCHLPTCILVALLHNHNYNLLASRKLFSLSACLSVFWVYIGLVLISSHFARKSKRRFKIVFLCSTNIIAFLTISKFPAPFNSLEELLDRSDFILGVQGGTNWEDLFKARCIMVVFVPSFYTCSYPSLR